MEGCRAREIDKCQSVCQYIKWSAISGRTYGNSRLEVYVRIYVTFEFRTKIDKGQRQEFRCIYLYIATSLFPKYLSTFLDVLSTEKILKQNKNTSAFPRTNSGHFGPLEWFCTSSVSEVVLNAPAKSPCLNVRVIKNNNKKKQQKPLNSVPVVEDGAKREGVVL